VRKAQKEFIVSVLGPERSPGGIVHQERHGNFRHGHNHAACFFGSHNSGAAVMAILTVIDVTVMRRPQCGYS